MDQLTPLDSTYGAVYVGVILSAVLYGVSCGQVFYYFRLKKDGPWTKAVVVATLISDTVHQALISHAAYTYLITYYFKSQKLGPVVWSLMVAVIFSGITALLVQTYYAVRIWKLSQRNVIIAAVLSVLIAGEFVSVLIYVVKAMKMTTFAEIRTLKAFLMAVNAFAAAGNALITIVFCNLLGRARNNPQRSNTMVDRLFSFTAQTGMLTSLFATASLVSAITSPDTFVYMCFYFMLDRLYCNSLMGSLSIPKVIRGRRRGDIGISLRPADWNSSTADDHKKIDLKAGIADVGPYGFITGNGAHGGNGSSPFVQSMSHTHRSRVVETGSDPESGQPQHSRTSVLLKVSPSAHFSTGSTD